MDGIYSLEEHDLSKKHGELAKICRLLKADIDKLGDGNRLSSMRSIDELEQFLVFSLALHLLHLGERQNVDPEQELEYTEKSTQPWA